MGRFRAPHVGAILIALITAGMAVIVAPLPASAAGPADHVIFWNDVLLRTYRQEGGAPGPLARSGAMLHAAIHDAASSVACSTRTTSGEILPHDGGSWADAGCFHTYKRFEWATVKTLTTFVTAIDHAAYTVLESIYPARDFDADLAAAQTGIAASPDRTEGIRVGLAVAQAMINARANDGSADNSPYTAGTNPGDWRPTGSGPAATPNWGGVTPFGLTSGAQFRPAPPAEYASMASLLASPEYAAQWDEVRRLGSATSTERTATQTQIAWFWANDLDGTYKPPGQLFAHTRIVAQSEGLDQLSNARLFALVGMAMADAGIAAWDAKYETSIDLWRPETAIHLADTDGNAATAPDLSWLPLSADRDEVHFSPPFPAYTSGHATFAAAWAGAMGGFFGTDSVTFTATTEDPHAVGVTRTFNSFTAAAVENARSRIYLGVHYQFDADEGVAAGTGVANHITANHLKRRLYLRNFYSDPETCEVTGENLIAEEGFHEYECRFVGTVPLGPYQLWVG